MAAWDTRREAHDNKRGKALGEEQIVTAFADKLSAEGGKGMKCQGDTEIGPDIGSTCVKGDP